VSAAGASPTTKRADWAAVTAVFALVLGFTYSDDLVEFAVDLSGGAAADWRWAVIGLDIALVAGTALLKWHMTAPPRDGRTFLRALLSGWWVLGAALVTVLHLMLLFGPRGERFAVADSGLLTIATTAGFVAAMGLLLVSALGGSSASRGWIVPVVIGTFVVQIASALWYPLIVDDGGCADNVSQQYFSGMVEVLPLLLVTLGLEVNYLRGRGIREPGQRAVPVLTVVLLCVAEALAFSMLVKNGEPACGVGARWHEYVAFVATVHAAAISLATLAWLLLSLADGSGEPRGLSERPDRLEARGRGTDE
jgi:hypothetical protein